MVEGDLAQTRARVAEARAQYVQQQQTVRQTAVALADTIGLQISQIEDVPVTTESWQDSSTKVDLDQLQGADALPASLAADIDGALERTADRLGADERDQRLAGTLDSLAAALKWEEGETVTQRRKAGLAETLVGLAARLR